MALLAKFFQSKRFSRGQDLPRPSGGDTTARWIVPEFKKTQIRLLVFKDHDVRGKTLLFDSKSIKLIDEKQEEESKQSNTTRRSLLRTYSPRKPSGLIDSKESLSSDSEQTNNSSPKTGRYQFLRPGSDVKMLGEMMFGCIPMSYRGTSLKVHYIRYPPQLVFTKVFVPSKSARGSSGEVDLYDSCSLQSLSCSDCSSARQITCTQRDRVDIARSVPVDMPKPYRSHNDTDDSGLSASLASSGSFTAFPSPGNSSINSNSYNSLHRRWIRSQQTCLEYGVRQRTEDCHQTPEPMPASQRKQKIGIGVVFDLFGEQEEENNRKFQQFFFSHITLFEGHVEKLKCHIERATCNKREFVHIVMEGLERFRTEVFDLYTAARLPDPVWLGMMSISDNRQLLCQQFVTDFIHVIQKCDIKSTNFFISTLITTVLTYHLAWVPTVTPAGANPSRTYLDKHSAKWLDALAKSHPYNPLWAQLSDLYGAIGYPLKLARTVVIGKKQELVKKVLRILTYFIRCSEVFESSKNDIFLDTEFDGSDNSNPMGYRGEMTLIEEESNSEHSNQTTPVHDQLKTICSNQDLAQITTTTSSSPASLTGSISNTSDVQFVTTTNAVKNDAQLTNSEGNTSTVRCRLSTVDFIEPKIENVSHVRRAVCSNNDVNEEKVHDKPSIELVPNKPKYLRLPSKESSIMNEMDDIFDDDCEAKTIDDISYQDRVTKYLAECEQFKGSMDIPDDPELLSLSNNAVSMRQCCSGDCRRSDECLNDKSNVSHCSNNITDLKSSIERLIESPTISNSDKHSDCIATPTPENVNNFDRMESSDSGSLGAQTVTCKIANADLVLDKSVTPTPENIKIIEQNLKLEMSSTDNQTSEQPRSRHNSGERLPARTVSKTSIPARCRSVTPTELGRRRHVSNNSVDSEVFDPFIDMKEIQMPRFDGEVNEVRSFDTNFGHSLIAGYMDHYMADFVLHGTSETTFYPRLINDLSLNTHTPVLDDAVKEAVCIVANCDDWSVKLISSNGLNLEKFPGIPQTSSQLVGHLIESVNDMWKMKMTADFCLMHLEDRLQEIYFKSRMIAEYLRDQKKVDVEEMTKMLGFHSSDLQLLLAVAQTHSPELAFQLS